MDNQKQLSAKIVKEFIQRYPNFPASTIQLFKDDVKDDGTDNTGIKMPVDTGWFEKCWEYNKGGRGVYFSVNEMIRGERNKKDTTKIRCWIVECDSLDKNTQFESYINSPIQPSLLIESKKSYHAYRFAEDGDKDTYETICGGLKQHFNGDQAIVKDWSRVLRIPGFYHLKDKTDPFMIRIVYKDEEKKHYTKEEMMKAFPYSNKEEVKEMSTETKEKFSGVWDTLKNRDHKKMLQDLSGTGLMDGEEITFESHGDGTEQICIGGKQTGSWMDIAGKIGSYKGGGPYRFNRVLFYQNITRPELLKWTLEKYKDNIPVDIYNKETSKMRIKKTLSLSDIKENFKHISYKEKLLKSRAEIQNTNPTEIIKWGWEEFDGKLGGIKTGKIYLFGAESGQGKTTFVNLVVDNVVKQGHQVVRYSLEDRLEDKGKEDLFDEINRLRFAMGKPLYSWVDFENNEYGSSEGKYFDEEFDMFMDEAIEKLGKMQITELERNKPVSIKELSLLIADKAKEGVRFFVIDHLHYFSMQNNERRDLEIQEIMLELNDLVRVYNISIFLIAHYSNYKKLGDRPHPSMFKDGASIKQVANIIIQIVSDSNTGETEFFFTKVRGRYRIPEGVILGRYDIKTSSYCFRKTTDQIKKEKKWGEG